MDNFNITIASVPDRDELVCEILYKGFQWAEISHETEEMTIQFFPYPKRDYWEFNLDEALATLEKAKKRMIGLGPKHPTPIDARCVDIRKYLEFFERGEILGVIYKGDKVFLTLESSYINPKAVDNRTILSKNCTLRGKLVLQRVESYCLDNKKTQPPKKQLFAGGKIVKLELKQTVAEIVFEYKEQSIKKRVAVKIEAQKIYWENLPTLSLIEAFNFKE
ncbi:hypothetical protein [Candidatus Neptunochlamydia vexilliferae]|uniref:Uncharacterized protein n=1 Tax=Candidatus Neptunichlamydia vexilliferae TaxID=1651774 RepID=A0ABS0AXQ8_9BACT|nr:hypothetical protein [Candidatus Neptunochlamydia vexilliferae]MBF5058913.1 hypothetical protein [Candidatus Neptunochlamydia vexilliferae]